LSVASAETCLRVQMSAGFAWERLLSWQALFLFCIKEWVVFTVDSYNEDSRCFWSRFSSALWWRRGLIVVIIIIVRWYLDSLIAIGFLSTASVCMESSSRRSLYHCCFLRTPFSRALFWRSFLHRCGFPGGRFGSCGSFPWGRLCIRAHINIGCHSAAAIVHIHSHGVNRTVVRVFIASPVLPFVLTDAR
jgi:hypothetical protein